MTGYYGGAMSASWQVVIHQVSLPRRWFPIMSIIRVLIVRGSESCCISIDILPFFKGAPLEPLGLGFTWPRRWPGLLKADSEACNSAWLRVASEPELALATVGTVTGNFTQGDPAAPARGQDRRLRSSWASLPVVPGPPAGISLQPPRP